MPDPKAEMIKLLFERIKALEKAALAQTILPEALLLVVNGNDNSKNPDQVIAISNMQIQEFLNSAGI